MYKFNYPPNLVQIGQNIGNLTWRNEYVLLVFLLAK